MSTPRKLPAASNLPELLSRPNVAFDYVLPGLKRGSVGALVSPGGVGKSFWSLEVAVAIAAGPHADLTGLAPTQGKVLVLSAEDDEDVLAQRLQDTMKHVRGNVLLDSLDYRSCLGLHVDLMELEWRQEILQAAAGARLVVLDTLTRFHNLDENSAQDMKRLLAQLENLAKESGASVLYLHHTNKAAVSNGLGDAQQAARGSSVLVDNARWSAFLAVMTEGERRRFNIAPEDRPLYVRWNVNKQNYGAPMADRWYKRDAAGVLLPVMLKAAAQDAAPVVGTPEARKPETAIPEKQAVTPSIPSTPAPPAPSAQSLPSANNAFEGQW